MICRVCDSRLLEPVIDLGMHPWGNHFLRPEECGTEPFYPLRVVHCAGCGTAQLDVTVPKEVMFGDHTYLSGVNTPLGLHFQALARDIDRRFFVDVADKAVLDIGSNDGTQLQHFAALGWRVQGVESSRTIARIANERGVPTGNVFFNEATATTLAAPFQVINAAGVFFHLEELHSVAEGIRKSLARDGVFVIQFLYTPHIVQNDAFDQIYHEHLLYYTLTTVERLLERHGMSCFDARLAPIHGGSMIAFAGHTGGPHATTPRVSQLLADEERQGSNTRAWYERFATRIRAVKDANLAYLAAHTRAGRRIYGMGAPVKGNTLLNYFGIGPDVIECLVERNPLRRGLYSPGMHIPVRLEDEVHDRPDVYYVLAWNYREAILERYADVVAAGTEFYFPVEPGRVRA